MSATMPCPQNTQSAFYGRFIITPRATTTKGTLPMPWQDSCGVTPFILSPDTFVDIELRHSLSPPTHPLYSPRAVASPRNRHNTSKTFPQQSHVGPVMPKTLSYLSSFPLELCATRTCRLEQQLGQQRAPEAVAPPRSPLFLFWLAGFVGRFLFSTGELLVWCPWDTTGSGIDEFFPSILLFILKRKMAENKALVLL